jgi:uncharacterized cupin superfamily protein
MPRFQAVIDFQTVPPFDADYRPPPDRIVSGDPVQRAAVLFKSEDGRFQSGIWQAEVGTWRVVFSESEFCYLLEGRITVRGDDGSEKTFAAGDAFLSPAGFTGTWEIVERAKKLFAFYE